MEGQYGYIQFFRKNGGLSDPYYLVQGKTTLGSSEDADIRLRVKHPLLKSEHCVLEVNETGIAEFINNSEQDTVKVNDKPVRQRVILRHLDIFEVIGKSFQYCNENLQINQPMLNTLKGPQISKVGYAKRKSVMPLIKSPKGSPTMKTKVLTRRRISSRKSICCCTNDRDVATTPDRRTNITDKSKTISRIAMSHNASPRARKNRLSLNTPKVSSRNILLSASCVREDMPASPSHSTPVQNEIYPMASRRSSKNISNVESGSESTPKLLHVKKTPQTEKLLKRTPINKRLEALKKPFSSARKEILVSAPIKSDNHNSPNEKMITRHRSINKSHLADISESLIDFNSPDNDKIRKRVSFSYVKDNSSLFGNAVEQEEQENGDVIEDSALNEDNPVCNLQTPTNIKRRSSVRRSNVSIKSNDTIKTAKTPTPVLRRSSVRNKNVSEDATPEKSDIVQDELETPKSIMKPRRSKALYNPQVEDITPVTPPIELSMEKKSDDVFKTPLNTPGLFESIRKTAVGSRKRGRESTGSVQRISKKLKLEASTMEDTPEQHLDTTAESNGGRRKSLKKKLLEKSPKNDLSNVAGVKKLLSTPKVQKSPKDDLTNVAGVKKLLATPKLLKSPKNDLTNIKGIKKLFSTPKPLKSPRNDLTNVVGIRKLLSTPKSPKGPKNDLTNVAGVKKLLSTPKPVKSPKNDLRNVAGVKKLLTTPKPLKSPKNDLRNVAGVKKLLKTPKPMKSPKNDLTNIAGVKKLLSTPKPIKSPKNDLTNVAGVKKLLSTPKPFKSPKNDLTNVAGVKRLLSTPRPAPSPINDLREIPNLRNIMYPKEQKSPKNDLSEIPRLRRIMSPKNQNGPKNDLSNIPNLRRLMSPKIQNSPKNDLRNISGIKELMSTPIPTKEPHNLGVIEGMASIFNISAIDPPQGSDIENSEELFNKLVGKKPLRTYRAQSMSPLKASAKYRNQRKTLGDAPETSPRVQKWVDDQAVLTLEKSMENIQDNVDNPKDYLFTERASASPKVQRKKGKKIMSNDDIDVVFEPPQKRTRGRKNPPEKENVNVEEMQIMKTRRNGRKNMEPVTVVADSINKTEKLKMVIENDGVEFLSPKNQGSAKLETRRGRKKVLEEDNNVEVVPPQKRKRGAQALTEEVMDYPPIKVTRGRQKKTENNIINAEYINNTDETQPDMLEASPVSKRAKNTVQSAAKASPNLPKRRGRPKKETTEIDSSTNNEEPVSGNKVSSAKITRTRQKKTTISDALNSNDELEECKTASPKKTRGRTRKAVPEDQPSELKNTKRATRKTTKKAEDEPNKKVVPGNTSPTNDSDNPMNEEMPKKTKRGKPVVETTSVNIDSPKKTRAKKGVNKRYSNGEYETTPAKERTKKVRFAKSEDAKKESPISMRPKRTRK